MTTQTSTSTSTSDGGLSIPRELWSRPDPDAAGSHTPEARLSLLTRLLPLVAAAGGYTSAVASTSGRHTLAGLLLVGVVAALLAFGVNVARFARAWVRRRRELAHRANPRPCAILDDARGDEGGVSR